MNEMLMVKPWGKDQGDYVLINASDFEPGVHELLDAAPAAQPADPDAQTRIDALKAALTEKGIKFRANASEAKLQEQLDASNAS